jgi:hypothetical protein
MYDFKRFCQIAVSQNRMQYNLLPQCCIILRY